MNYLMPLWGGVTNKYLRKAQVIINTAARWVTGLTRRTKTTELMKAVGWFTVTEQVKIVTSIFTWKLVHRSKPARLLEIITVLDDFSLQVNEPRLQFSKLSYRWRAGEQWNSYTTGSETRALNCKVQKETEANINAGENLGSCRLRTEGFND